jgi:hypothetical protein
MAVILSESDVARFGVTHSLNWSRDLDARSLVALRRLVPAESCVAAVRSWAAQDGCSALKPIAFVAGHPAHVPIIMEELLAAIPDMLFVVDNPDVLQMRMSLVGARKIWGDALLPSVDTSPAALKAWAAHLVHGMRLMAFEHTDPQYCCANWSVARTLLLLAGKTPPDILALVDPLPRLIAARNVGLPAVPDDLVEFCDWLDERIDSALAKLARGVDVGTVSASFACLL